jgi:hypothetical protein
MYNLTFYVFALQTLTPTLPSVSMTRILGA